jgi:uncharacterized RDD family membrane protein YckC
MKRVIRSERARELQGTRAGLVSRLLANALDAGVVFLIYLGVIWGFALLGSIITRAELHTPQPPTWLTIALLALIAISYLTVGWSTTGRTVGKQVLGLRAVTSSGTWIRPGRALARAVMCLLVPLGLVVVLVSRGNLSLQDHLCRTAVVYDWVPETGAPLALLRSQRADA